MSRDFADQPRPLVVSGLPAELNEVLAGAVPEVRLVPVSESAPWEIPEGAGMVLIAPANAWRQAPGTAPTNWSRVTHVQAITAGMDNYPGWVQQAPYLACGRGFTSGAIAEYVIGAMLNHAKGYDRNRVRAEAQWVRERRVDGLQEATVGIAGYGAIGSEVASRALAFGMKVLVRRRSGEPLPEGIQTVADLGELAARSDHLVIAMPLTEETRKAIGAAVLARARHGLHVINVSRGAILDLEALREALDAGRVAAATLDVTEPEPLPGGHWAYDHPGILLTPHLSWRGDAATSRRKFEVLTTNLRRFAASEPMINAFDAARGY